MIGDLRNAGKRPSNGGKLEWRENLAVARVWKIYYLALWYLVLGGLRGVQTAQRVRKAVQNIRKFPSHNRNIRASSRPPLLSTDGAICCAIHKPRSKRWGPSPIMQFASEVQRRKAKANKL